MSNKIEPLDVKGYVSEPAIMNKINELVAAINELLKAGKKK